MRNSKAESALSGHPSHVARTGDISIRRQSPGGRAATESIPKHDPSSGILHERDLLYRIAIVRFVLTIANVPVIILDRSVPSAGTPMAYTWAFLAAGAFIIYAVSFLWFVRRPVGVPNRIAVASPLLDVLFAALLIVATDGYLSPFHLWLVFAVVSAGFSRYRTLPFATAFFALAAHSLIAIIPQEQPLDVSIFAVRAGYVFGVAAVLSTICSFLTVQSFALSKIEEAGRKFAEAMSETDMLRMLIEQLVAAIDFDRVEVELTHGVSLASGSIVENGRLPSLSIGLSGAIGVMRGFRKKALTRTESTMTRVLCDRASASIRRIAVTHELARAAAVNERLRMTDELHDTSIQSLAALDFRLEAARAAAEGSNFELARDLSSIKGIARMVSSQIRDALTARGDEVVVGADVLIRLVRQRWPVGSEVAIAPEITLLPRQWHVVDAFIRTGLGNAKRHGEAQCVRLEIRQIGDGLIHCTLENDGNALQTPVEFGYGLRRLEEMSDEIGGVIRLESRDPDGARLVLEFAIDP
ncbi:MAG: hypothetical protein HY287_10275 [Planctomycetes bacterium]|nr:hypothetical protein [Planctomycetota bacterium]MBI3834702.1 hypothetical protein [Planctomycetota bacterium]